MKKFSYYSFLSVCMVSGFVLAGNVAQLSTPFIPAAHAQTALSDSQLKDWLTKTGNEMVSVVNANYSKKEQKEKFLAILSKYVDVDGIGKFCLGRFWRVATPDQQQQYIKLFHQVLINSITDRLGEYKGVAFQVGKIVPMEGGRKSIQTIIIRPKQPAVSVQWVINTESGNPKVVDIIGENASLAITQQNDYTSFIAHHGNSVASLIQALERQIKNHK